MDAADLWLNRLVLDRMAERRLDDAVLGEACRAGDVRLVTFHGDAVEVRDGRLALTSCEDFGDVFLLGQSDGITYVAHDHGVPDDRLTGLRAVASELDPLESALASTAIVLGRWRAGHRFCGRCGAPTEPAGAGWILRCTACGTEHYPRTDPVVIMAVRDADDRLLISRGPNWAERRYSVPAGFVDAGESLEDAVRREVAEEVGLTVERVEFRWSQPWPFAGQLMCGFAAWARGDIRIDPAEIADARWVTRPELADLIAHEGLGLPGRYAVGRLLIEDWYGEPLPLP